MYASFRIMMNLITESDHTRAKTRKSDYLTQIRTWYISINVQYRVRQWPQDLREKKNRYKRSSKNITLESREVERSL